MGGQARFQCIEPAVDVRWPDTQRGRFQARLALEVVNRAQALIEIEPNLTGQWRQRFVGAIIDAAQELCELPLNPGSHFTKLFVGGARGALLQTRGLLLQNHPSRSQTAQLLFERAFRHRGERLQCAHRAVGA
jgi:hypothetical protein